MRDYDRFISMAGLLIGVLFLRGCQKAVVPAALPASAPGAMRVERTGGRVTLASVGWPMSAGSKVWLVETPGAAIVRLGDGETQSIEYSGFTMLAVSAEVAAIEFRLKHESFEDAYHRAKEIARLYNLSPLSRLDEWYKYDGKSHHLRMNQNVNRVETTYIVGVSVDTLASTNRDAYVTISYNLKVIDKVIGGGGYLNGP